MFKDFLMKGYNFSQGMENIHSNTCIEFVLATEDDEAYVNISKYVGRTCFARELG